MTLNVKKSSVDQDKTVGILSHIILDDSKRILQKKLIESNTIKKIHGLTHTKMKKII